MVNLHPYTTNAEVRSRCGNFDVSDVSNADIDLVIEGNADFVELETQHVAGGWDSSNSLTNNYIRQLVRDYSAADIIEIWVSRFVGESAKVEAKMIREWADRKLQALKDNLVTPEQDAIIHNVIGSYETYDAMLHDGSTEPQVYRSTNFV